MISFIHKEFSVRTKLTSKLMFTDILRRKNFFNDKKIKKTECPFKRSGDSTKNTMGNSVKARFTRLPSAIFFLKFFYVFFSNSCIWKMPYFRNLFITKISFFCFEKTKMCKWALANFWNCGTQFFTCWTASPRTG